MYTLYYSFTTWAKDVITPRYKGRIFFEEDAEYEDLAPGTSVINVMRMKYPPAYTLQLAASENTSTIAQNQKQNGILPSESNNLETFLAMFPALTPPPQLERTEFDSFRKFQQEIEGFVASLLEREAQDIPTFQELRSCMRKYSNVAETLKALDDEFLSLTSRMYENQPLPFQGAYVLLG